MKVWFRWFSFAKYVIFRFQPLIFQGLYPNHLRCLEIDFNLSLNYPPENQHMLWDTTKTVTLLKFNSKTHLKNDGLEEYILSFWDSAYFQGRTCCLVWSAFSRMNDSVIDLATGVPQRLPIKSFHLLNLKPCGTKYRYIGKWKFQLSWGFFQHTSWNILLNLYQHALFFVIPFIRFLDGDYLGCADKDVNLREGKLTLR